MKYLRDISGFALAITVAYWLMAAIYIVMMQDSLLSIAIRLPRMDFWNDFSELMLGYVISLLPLLWLRALDKRPSKALYTYLMFSIMLPSVIFLVTNDNMTVADRNFRAVFCVFCFFVIYLQYYAHPLKMRPIRYQGTIGWSLVLGVATLGSAYVFLLNPSALANLRIFDVYEQRLDLRDAVNAGTFNRLNVYLTNWMGMAIAPFLAAYGIYTRRYRYVVLSVVMAFIAFAVSTHKSVLFTTLIVVVFAISMQLSKRFALLPKTTPLNVAFVVIAIFLVVPFATDMFLNRGAVVTAVTSFRLSLNNGYLTSIYFEFFGDQDMLLYADSFLRGIVDNPHDLSYSRRVGNYLTNYDSRNSANANFLADGYVNLGYAGMVFSSLQLGLVLWLMDSLARGRNAVMVACVILPAGLVFSNVPIHTGLVSNGIAVCMLLLTLLPKERPPQTARKYFNTSINWRNI